MAVAIITLEVVRHMQHGSQINTCISVKNCFLVDVNCYPVKFILRNIFEIKYL